MTKDSEKLLKVTDSSCTHTDPERVHDVFVRGVLTRTVFKYGQDTILAFEHGIKFMLDGFKVEEADGLTLNLPAVTKESVKSQLAQDQVIANLSELTLASLKLRAGQKAGGEVFMDADDVDRSDIIAFLLGNPPVAAADETVENVDGEDDLVDHEGDDDGETTVTVPPVGDNPPAPAKSGFMNLLRGGKPAPAPIPVNMPVSTGTEPAPETNVIDYNPAE
jgi:hypothetical protein